MKKWTFIAAALVFLTLSCTKEQRKSMPNVDVDM